VYVVHCCFWCAAVCGVLLYLVCCFRCAAVSAYSTALRVCLVRVSTRARISCACVRPSPSSSLSPPAPSSHSLSPSPTPSCPKRVLASWRRHRRRRRTRTSSLPAPCCTCLPHREVSACGLACCVSVVWCGVSVLCGVVLVLCGVVLASRARDPAHARQVLAKDTALEILRCRSLSVHSLRYHPVLVRAIDCVYLAETHTDKTETQGTNSNINMYQSSSAQSIKSTRERARTHTHIHAHAHLQRRRCRQWRRYDPKTRRLGTAHTPLPPPPRYLQRKSIRASNHSRRGRRQRGAVCSCCLRGLEVWGLPFSAG